MNSSQILFDVNVARKDFPALTYCNENNEPIVYLDNSATTQRPQCVIDALTDFYLHNNANVHRGFYEWGRLATKAYEGTRQFLADFLHAKHVEEIVFTRGATESINCLAEIIGQRFFEKDDEVIVSELEHHSNMIPWQMQQTKRGIHVKGWSFDEDGNLDLNQLKELLTTQTKLLAVTHVSNVIGTTPPLKEIISMAHNNGTKVLIDASQAVAHLPINVQDLDCDFLVGSGHKMYGPMGSGFFYGKKEILEELPPYHGGGTMMETVYIDSFTPAAIPSRFEAGTHYKLVISPYANKELKYDFQNWIFINESQNVGRVFLGIGGKGDSVWIDYYEKKCQDRYSTCEVRKYGNDVLVGFPECPLANMFDEKAKNKWY